MTNQSAGLFEPDALLPTQFYNSFRGSSRVRGERRLMLAVLEDALDCYRKYAFTMDGLGRQQFEDADVWICSNDRRWSYSFENICEILEIDPDYLRRGVHQWRDRGFRSDDQSIQAVG